MPYTVVDAAGAGPPSAPPENAGGVNTTVALASSNGERDYCILAILTIRMMLCHMSVTSGDFPRKAHCLEDVSE